MHSKVATFTDICVAELLQSHINVCNFFFFIKRKKYLVLVFAGETMKHVHHQLIISRAVINPIQTRDGGRGGGGGRL